MKRTWKERIEAARARGWFTDQDVTLATSWCGCACAELRGMELPDADAPSDEPLTPVVAYYGPDDSQPRAWSLGLEFASAVARGEFDRAEAARAELAEMDWSGQQVGTEAE